jgi:hypothetical protein
MPAAQRAGSHRPTGCEVRRVCAQLECAAVAACEWRLACATEKGHTRESRHLNMTLPPCFSPQQYC